MIMCGASLISFFAFLLVSPDPSWWRHVLLLCIIPPCVAFAFTFLGMPESPRYLQRTAGPDQAAAVLATVLGTRTCDPEVTEALHTWMQEARNQQQGSGEHIAQSREVIMSKRGQASLLVNLNQGICGMSVFGGMPVMILEGHGMLPSQAQGVLFVGNVVSFLCNLGAIFLVDRTGRSPLLLPSTA